MKWKLLQIRGLENNIQTDLLEVYRFSWIIVGLTSLYLHRYNEPIPIWVWKGWFDETEN